MKIHSLFPIQVLLALCFVLTGAQFSTADDITFIPENINYGNVRMLSCKPRMMCAVNEGESAIDNPGFTLDGPPEFDIQGSFQDCPDPLQPGDICKIYIDFCPSSVKNYKAVLKFSASDTAVPLTGSGFTPHY